MPGMTRRHLIGGGIATAGGLLLAGRPTQAQNAADTGRSMAALAMHGAPLYPEDFPYFRSVNPDAPRGGRLRQSAVGSFDSLNPFIVRGNAPPIIRWSIVESLMKRGPDEAFTVYPLLARRIETDDARSYVAFELDPAARFSDGAPVTAQDVLFSYELLHRRGRPNMRSYYGKVAAAEITDERRILFRFGEADRELPLILALMPILARHAVNEARFEETSFAAPLGSGPYVVTEVRPGTSIVMARAPDYWGRDLPVNRGLFNFDTLSYEFFRDVNSQFEAFKRDLYDIRFETDPGRWKTGYDFPAVRQGRVRLEEIADGQPDPYSALIFNMRRPPFADARVREAMVELFDFEWINANLYFGVYRRTASFFEGSELSARGRPAGEREREWLAPFADAVLPAVMEGTWQPPVSDGSGRDRERLRRALELFAAAGFELRNGKLVDRGTGRPLVVEILVGTKDQERLSLAYRYMLRRAGVELAVRLVDNVQFETRKQTYDYDMVPYIWVQTLSPGNEQSFYFGSAAADTPGTRNFMGLRSAATDAMIAALLAARSREDFVAAVRALDRVLISAQFAVPLFHTPGQWLARWRRIARPEVVSLSGSLAESWWLDER
ncbi:extracellular solute-binding protein [Ancylobacter terrae]|uniref:extracellular solute-binding protein n=1 Tax=Ancylobacter sp. sgz301288 TaxID=3342077 RepID=UPI00385AE6DF